MMSDTRKIATIIGGDGFLSGYLVERLVKKGFVVRLAVDMPAYTKDQKLYGKVGQVIPLYCSIDQENTVARAVEGAHLVINLTEAYLGKSKAKLEKFNVGASKIIARICAAAGVKKLLHFSSLGSNLQSSSPYLISKKQGEEEILKAYPSAIIVRMGVLFGPEDQFLNKIALMATFLPILPIYNVNTKLQPVYVGDVADATIRIVESDSITGDIFELAGPTVYTNRNLVTKIVEILHRNNDITGLFPGFIRCMAFILQFMPGSLMTSHLINMMKYDSVADKNNKSLQSLGLVPTSIEMIAPCYLYAYRPACDFVELRKLQKSMD